MHLLYQMHCYIFAFDIEGKFIFLYPVKAMLQMKDAKGNITLNLKYKYKHAKRANVFKTAKTVAIVLNENVRTKKFLTLISNIM